MRHAFVRALQNWRLRNVTRRKLAQLDDRLLADMGIERDSIDGFVARHTSEKTQCQ